MRVRDLMTPDPVAVPPGMTIEALVHLLAERHVSGVFVVGPGGRPLGVVTEADVIRRLAPDSEQADLGWLGRVLANSRDAAVRYARIHGTRARDVMTPGLVFVAEHSPAEEAARLMRERRIRRVAVMREGRLVGVVSRADLLKAVAVDRDRLGAETPDQRIRLEIVREMRRQSWSHPGLTTVLVQDGVVRLEGYCASKEERQALHVLAERVEGVRGIKDRLEELPPADYPLMRPI